MRKNFGNTLSLLSIVIVILSIVKTFLFYINFNVPIGNYITLSELGLSITDNLLVTIPIALSVFIYDFFFKEKIDVNNYIEQQRILEQNKTKTQVKIDERFRKGFKVFFGVFCLVILSLIIRENVFSTRIVMTSLLLFLIFSYIGVFKKRKLESLIPLPKSGTTLYISLFCLAFSFAISSDITKVEFGKFKGTKIMTTDSTYISTDSAFYIGQTESYIFFYNKIDKHTSIIPVAALKRLELYSR